MKRHSFTLREQQVATERRPSGRIPQGGEALAAQINALGYAVTFQRWSKTAPDGSALYSVYLYRPGASCLRKSLGQFAKLVLLPEETIAAKIAKLFSRGTP